MLCRRLSIPVLAFTSCRLLTGCFGGQAGDEGLGPDKNGAGRGGAGGTAGDDVTAGVGDRDDQECTDALFHPCSQSCEGPLGQCDPLQETDEVGFQCDCTYYGEISRKT